METALVLEAPEAEPLVSHWRQKHDPSAAAGMPAHVTLIYPFALFSDIDDGLNHKLRSVFAAAPPLEITFAGTSRFPDTLWLAPDDPAPIVALTEILAKAFPDCPPYGGAFPDITPHLTVAHVFGEGRGPDLEELEAAFRAESATQLPIKSTVQHASMFKKHEDRWQRAETFPFGG